MQASMREFLEDRLNITAPNALTAVVAVLALSASGWQALRWYGSVDASLPLDAHPPVVAAAAPDPLPVILSANVFGAAASAVADSTSATPVARESTGFILRAAFAEADGGGGAIIENSSGQADWYAVGQSVAPGLTLREVRPDHVVLDRGGSPERLQFERLAEVAMNPSPSPSDQAGGTPTFTVEPGQPQPIPRDMAPEDKANLIRQRLEELRNRTRK